MLVFEHFSLISVIDVDIVHGFCLFQFVVNILNCNIVNEGAINHHGPDGQIYCVKVLHIALFLALDVGVGIVL